MEIRTLNPIIQAAHGKFVADCLAGEITPYFNRGNVIKVAITGGMPNPFRLLLQGCMVLGILALLAPFVGLIGFSPGTCLMFGLVAALLCTALQSIARHCVMKAALKCPDFWHRLFREGIIRTRIKAGY